ncbi:hypothetical protein LINPERHAP1_LOCUS9551 [Linum perenne]
MVQLAALRETSPGGRVRDWIVLQSVWSLWFDRQVLWRGMSGRSMHWRWWRLQ